MTAKAILAVGTPATTLVAFVNDVLAPLGPLALYIAAVAGLSLVVFILPLRWVEAFGKRLFASYWRIPAVATLAVSVFLLAIAHVVTRHAPAEGWLASHVSAVHDFQSSLGIVAAQTQEIAATARSIKKDTQQINAKLDQVKKETSSDPREELANLGVAWSTQGFVDALEAADARTVRLFLEGGMSPAVLHDGASAVLFTLQPNLPDPIPMLKLMIDAGFDVNTNLIDTYIMPSYGDAIPPDFQSPDLPTGYSAYDRTFAGPALLWVVIRAAWAGPTRSDLAVIEFLRRHGADTKLPREFLTALQPAWGYTESFQRVRAAIG